MGLNSEATQAPARRIATDEAAQVWEDRKGPQGQTPPSIYGVSWRSGPKIPAKWSKDRGRASSARQRYGPPWSTRGRNCQEIFVCRATYQATQLVVALMGEKSATKRTRL